MKTNTFSMNLGKLLLPVILLLCQERGFARSINLELIPQAPPSETLADSVSAEPEILGIRTREVMSKQSTGRSLRVNSLVEVLISNPDVFFSQRPPHSELILFANGLPLKGISSTYFGSAENPYSIPPKVNWKKGHWIPFLFTRDSTNKEAWNCLFKLTNWKKNAVNLDLSIGWSGTYPLTYKAGERILPLTLFFYTDKLFWILATLYLLAMGGFIWLCSTTGLIRDPDITAGGKPGAYSLSQTQLVFWTVIIFGAFIYLTLLTGLADSMNDTALILLGISGGTTGLAAFIDSLNKKKTEKTEIATGKPHHSFLKDILSDGENVSVQRTQVLLWNLALGCYFIWYVIYNKSMPLFSVTLLTLAGISSLMYLTSKGTEKPATTVAPPPEDNLVQANGPVPPEPPVVPEQPGDEAAGPINRPDPGGAEG